MENNNQQNDLQHEEHDLVKLGKLPVADALIKALMFEALQPLCDPNPTLLALQTGRRNLAVELLTTMEIIK